VPYITIEYEEEYMAKIFDDDDNGYFTKVIILNYIKKIVLSFV